MQKLTKRILIFVVMSMLICSASVANEVKIGIIGTFSGPAAYTGDYTMKAIHLYLKQHPDAIGDNTVTFVKRDATGPNPSIAKRLARELVIQDDVDVIVGLQWSNNAFSVLDVANKAHVPVVIFNAATASLTTASPYVVRVSRTMWQSSYPLGKYAFNKLGLKTANIMYADYAPGTDAKNAFKAGFTKAGGKIIQEIPLPFPEAPDLTSFFRKIKGDGADALYAFMPAGNYSAIFMKGYVNAGLEGSTQLIGPVDIAPFRLLERMGKGIEGAILMSHYSPALDNKENQEFLTAWRDAYPDTPVSMFAVQNYDGMAAVAAAIRKTGGSFDAQGFVDALKGWTFDSPRGPITIDPNTRDIVENQYVVKVVRNEEGELDEQIIDIIPAVKDPWKELQ